AGDAGTLPGRSGEQPAQDAVGQDRDLLREDRLVRLRRLPRPRGVAGADRMAGLEEDRALSPAHAVGPADRQAAQPARPQPARQGDQGEGPPADHPPSRRCQGTRPRRRRPRAGVQRSRRLPRCRAHERPHPPRRGAALDRRMVRSGRLGLQQAAREARQSQRADARHRRLQAEPGLHRPDLPGRDRALRRAGTAGDRAPATGDRATVDRFRRGCGIVVTSGSRAPADRLSRLCSIGIVPPMSEVVSPFPTWLTYHQVAERMGLRTANAAAARARRAKWPKRIRNDTLEVEVCVPAEALVAGPPKAGERSHPRDRADENLQTTAEAVAAAVAPLQSIIESLSGELNAAHGANDALRDQVAAARATTAEFRGKSMAIEAALERGLAEQRDLQQQVVHLRREYQSVQERVVQAQGEAFDERRLRLSTEDLLARLKYELSELREASERRRWWRRR